MEEPPPKKTKCVKNNNNISFTLQNFIENNIDLYKLKLPQLKNIAKKIKLKTSLKKHVLIESIQQYFTKVIKSIIIQKIFRGHIVRTSFRIRGPAFKNRKLCVNDKDCFTLEPIAEIPFQRFYSYVDTKKFIYGFDVIQLIIAQKKKERLNNPFSREAIPQEEINKITQLEYAIKILYPELIDPDELNKINYNITPINGMNLRRQNQHIRFNYNGDEHRREMPPSLRDTAERVERNLNDLASPPINALNLHERRFLYSFPSVSAIITEATTRAGLTQLTHQYRNTNMTTGNNTNNGNFILPIQTHHNLPVNYLSTTANPELENKMNEIRNKPMSIRVEELFIEIDLLGNYSSSRWFSEIQNYHIFLNNLYSVWNFRLRTPIEEKRKISQLYDPFMGYTNHNTRHLLNHHIKEICITVMENMIYGGINIEYRKLGAYRVLMALTMVDINARETYRWLYETIA